MNNMSHSNNMNMNGTNYQFEQSKEFQLLSSNLITNE